MAYGEFKDLPRRTTSDKVLCDKAFDFAKYPKYDGFQRGLASMVYKFFNKKSSSLADESTRGGGCKSAIKKNLLEKRRVYSSFKNNILDAGLADMQLIKTLDKGIRFSLCVIDIFSKYARVILLKYKKGTKISNALQKFLDESKRKPSKIWVAKESTFSNRSMKFSLQDNNIEMYSANKEGKSVVAERFIRTLKTNI